MKLFNLYDFEFDSPQYQIDGNWTDYLPEFENQKNQFLDSKCCTVFGTLNAIEILDRRVFDKKSNYSDRFTAITSKTTTSGNDPEKVARSIKYNGLIDEKLLPFDDRIKNAEQFFTLENEECLFPAANDWLYQYDFSFQKINTSHKSIIANLKKSPIGMSVFSWSKNSSGLYTRPPQFQDNHFVVLFNYKEGEYWEVLDSYNQNIKKVEWNYPFTSMFVYSIKYKKPSWLSRLFKNK